MTSISSPFRGYASIREVAARVDRLVAWWREQATILGAGRDGVWITIKRTDYDLIKRWPKAGKMLNFDYASDGSVWYRGFRLRPDTGAGRYEKQDIPTTETI